MKDFRFYLIGLILLGAPLVAAPWFFSFFELPKVVFFRVCIGLLLIFTGWFVFKKSSIPWHKTGVFFWMIFTLYILAFALSIFFSISPGVSFWGSYERQQGGLQFLNYILFFLLCLGLIDKEKIKRLIPLICGVAVSVAVLGILQQFIPLLTAFLDVDVLRGRLSIGTLGHPSFFAAYLMMILPFFFIGKKSWYFRAGGLIVLLAVFLTLSRAALIGIFAGSIFLGILRYRKFLIVPLVIILLMIAANLGFNKGLLDRLVLHNEASRSVETRFIIWEGTFEMIKEKPLTGYGPEMFGEAFSKYASADLLRLEPGSGIPDRAHNELLDIASTAGLFGLAAYLLFLGFVIKIAIKERKNDYALAAGTSLVMIFAANQFGFSLTVSHLYWWFFVAVILLIHFKSSEIKISKKFGAAIFGISLITGSWFILTSTNALWADHLYLKGIKSFKRNAVDEAFGYMSSAINLNPYQSYYSFSNANFFIERAYDQSPEMKETYEFWANRFLEQGKNVAGEETIEALALRGELFALKGNFKEAAIYFKKAHQKAPTKLWILKKWAQALKKGHQYEESFQRYADFIELIPYGKELKKVESMAMWEKEMFRIFFKHNKDVFVIFDEAIDVARLAKKEDHAIKWEKQKEYLAHTLDIILSLNKIKAMIYTLEKKSKKQIS